MAGPKRMTAGWKAYSLKVKKKKKHQQKLLLYI